MFQFSKTLLRIAIPVLAYTGLGQSQMLRPMTHHVRDVTQTGAAPFVQRLPLNRVMQLDLVLPLNDQAGLDAFIKAVNDPSGSSYHHYVTPAEFTARFGPTQAQYPDLPMTISCSWRWSPADPGAIDVYFKK